MLRVLSAYQKLLAFVETEMALPPKTSSTCASKPRVPAKFASRGGRLKMGFCYSLLPDLLDDGHLLNMWMPFRGNFITQILPRKKILIIRFWTSNLSY